MANKTIQTAYGSTTTALSTELNSLTTATMSSLGTAFNNGTNLDMWVDAVVTIAAQGSSRASTALIELYMCPALDGTNYDRLLRGISELVGSFALDAATTATQRTIRDIWVPPSATVKFGLYNATGQSLASSGNTVVLYPRSLNNNG